jgi:hypothetical protein
MIDISRTKVGYFLKNTELCPELCPDASVKGGKTQEFSGQLFHLGRRPKSEKAK